MCSHSSDNMSGATEHVSASAPDEISLDEIIAKVQAAAKADAEGEEILAAALTLRDNASSY